MTDRKFNENVCTECKEVICTEDMNDIVRLKTCPEYIEKHMKIRSSDNTIVAVSKYNGKSVRGVAKCSPQDTFDYSCGKRLAIARCNFKVAHKRACRAEEKVEAAEQALKEAVYNFEKAKQFKEDADKIRLVAAEELHNIASIVYEGK